MANFPQGEELRVGSRLGNSGADRSHDRSAGQRHDRNPDTAPLAAEFRDTELGVPGHAAGNSVGRDARAPSPASGAFAAADGLAVAGTLADQLLATMLWGRAPRRRASRK